MRAIWTHIYHYFGNARGLVLLLAIVLVLPFAQPQLSRLDNQWFSWVSYLHQQNAGTGKLVIIETPGDVTGIEFRQFIERLADQRPAAMGFIGFPLDSELREGLRNASVPVGLSPSAINQDVFEFSTASRIALADPSNKASLIASVVEQPTRLELDSQLRKTSLYVPLEIDPAQQHELVWLQGTTPIPDLIMRMYSKVNKRDKLRWQDGIGLTVDQSKLITGPSGKVRIPSSIQVDTAYFNSTEFGRGESLRRFRDKIILLGQGNLPQMETAARTLSAMLSGDSVASPAWTYWLVIALLVFSLAYLFIFLPRVRFTTGTLLSGMLVTIIVTGQLGLLLITRYWLPATLLVVFILVSHVLMMTVLRHEKNLRRLVKAKDDALLQLGKKEVETGEYDAAANTLLHSNASDEVFEQLYAIGIEYERQRRYDKAFRIFGRISRVQKGYRDVAQRLKSLADVQNQTSPGNSGFNGASTLVIPEMGLEHPVLGRYELRREIGRGAMGIVYLGHDPKIVRDVAVKTINLKQFSGREADAIKTRFFREAEAAGRLNHPNIVTVFDIGDEQSLAFIAMDYVPGRPLSEYTGADETLDCHTVYRLIGQAAQAIDYAHRQGIVHRDIKPGNILYNESDERIKVSDFGIARVTDTTTTRTGTVLGSPSYMAPEQLTDGKVDGRADIFSLGVTLYQLLTGELPFKGDSLPSLAYQITNKRHRNIRELRPELPAKIVRIINKALQKNPDKRYASAQEMADALAKA